VNTIEQVCDEVGSDTLRVDAAYHALLDALACALPALQNPACTRLLGPVVPGATMHFGARVPGTSLQLDPVQASFNFGTMIGWLDQQDSALAGPYGHLADSLGAVLGIADQQARKALAEGRSPATVLDVLVAMRDAHACQHAVMLSAPGSGKAGPDRCDAVRVASAIAVAALLGATPARIERARELAAAETRADTAHAARPRWWLGDANSRGVRIALLAMAEEAPIAARTSAPPSYPARSAPALDAVAATRIREHCLASVAAHYPPAQAAKIKAMLEVRARLEAMPINDLVSLTVRN
jgi:2-methylcitrate dehydratase